MAIVGISAHVWKGKRDQGLKLNADIETLDRDLIFFLIFFALALLAGLVLPDPLHIPAAIGLLRRLRHLRSREPCEGGGDVQEVDSSVASTSTARRATEPPLWLAIVQFVVSLGAIVGGAHLFVEEMIKVAEDDRRRAARALPDPRAARDGTAREDQQHLLGPRRQGQPRPRQHHRRDGLPVDDPDRRRPPAHRLGAEPLRGRLVRSSACWAARSPTGPFVSAAASNGRRSSSGRSSSSPSSATCWSAERRLTSSSSGSSGVEAVEVGVVLSVVGVVDRGR